MSERPFICLRCGICCQGKGGVYLTEDSIDTISTHLSLSREVFKERYLEVGKNNAFSVKSEKDAPFTCLLLKERTCLIHKHKPNICALWPFLPTLVKRKESFLEASRACPGLSLMSYEEFLRDFERLRIEKTRKLHSAKDQGERQ